MTTSPHDLLHPHAIPFPGNRSGGIGVSWRGVMAGPALAVDARVLAAAQTPGFEMEPAGILSLVVLLGVVVGLAFILYRRLRRRARQRFRSEVERSVQARTAHLARADAAKTMFIAQLSHEIRNPLNGLLGAAIALDAAPLSPEATEQVRTVRACAALMAEVVDDVLDFARIEAGAIDVRHEAYDPRAVLAAVARILSGPARDAGVTLAVTVSPEVSALVMGDPTRVQQIIVNFALNAIKFAGGGSVDLTLEVAGSALLYRVADRGQGISDAEKARLFTSFARVADPRRAGIPGHGLGLAVSRTLAEQMGGSVGVQDRPGGGSIFHLRLALERPVQDLIAKPDPVPSFAGARALIVEDLDFNAAALEFMLRKLGFECDRARIAGEAAERFAATEYDVLFVDCDLPGQDGISLVRRLKSSHHRGRTPLFIAISASPTWAIRQACLDAGLDAFVAKPITPERLRCALEAFSAPARGGMSVQLPQPPSAATEMIEYLGGGSEKGRRESRSRFAFALDQSLDRMTDALRAEDRGQLRRCAHHLVSLARMIGAQDLALVAGRLEEIAPHGTRPDLQMLVNAIDAQGRSATNALRNQKAPRAPA